MANRLPIIFAGAGVVAIMVIAALSVVWGGTRIAVGGGNTLTKVADNQDVQPGDQIGFVIHFVYDGTDNQTVYIEDDLPTTNGIDWQVESFSGATTCEISGTNPPHLECVGEASATGFLEITVHITSQTTQGVCGQLINQAAAGGFQEADEFATAHININCPTPTPSPSPSPSPTPSPTPEPFLPRPFGGHDSQGDNVVIFLPPPQSTGTFVGFEIPLGPACPGQNPTFQVSGILLSADKSFDGQDGTHEVHGTLTDENGLQIAQGNITVGAGTECANTLAFVTELSDRALLVGDIDCSWPRLYDSAATVGDAFPQGTPVPTTPPDPKKSITVKDVIAVLKWVAGFEEDSPPLDCPLLDAAFPTPVTGSATPTVIPTSTARPVHLQGDADCSGTISAQDALELLQFAAGLDQPSCGGVKVGHFYLLDR